MKKYFKKANKIIWQKRIRVFFLACLTFVSLGLIIQLKQTQNSLNVSNSITIKKSNNQSQISQFKTGIGALPQHAMAASPDSDPPTIPPGSGRITPIDPTISAPEPAKPSITLDKLLQIKKVTGYTVDEKTSDGEKTITISNLNFQIKASNIPTFNENFEFQYWARDKWKNFNFKEVPASDDSTWLHTNFEDRQNVNFSYNSEFRLKFKEKKNKKEISLQEKLELLDTYEKDKDPEYVDYFLVEEKKDEHYLYIPWIEDGDVVKSLPLEEFGFKRTVEHSKAENTKGAITVSRLYNNKFNVEIEKKATTTTTSLGLAEKFKKENTYSVNKVSRTRYTYLKKIKVQVDPGIYSMWISAGDNSKSKTYFLILKHNQIHLKDIQNIKFSTTKTSPTHYKAKDAKLTILNFSKIKQNYKNVDFQYKESRLVNGWVNIPDEGEITNLSPGTYNIGVKPKPGFNLVELSNKVEIESTPDVLDISNQVKSEDLTPSPLTIEESKYWKAPPKIVFTLVHEEYKGDGKGEIKLDKFEGIYSKLEYRKLLLLPSTSWVEVSETILKVDPGTYSFKWTPKKPDNAVKYKNPIIGGDDLDEIVLTQPIKIKPGKPIPDPPTLNFNQENEKFKNVNDGKIKIMNWADLKKTSKLKYKLVSSVKWIDVKNQNLEGLKPGTYQFKWVANFGGLYADGNKEKSISSKVTLKAGNWVAPPNTNITWESDETIKGAKDGKITITNFKDDKSQLQYTFKENDDWKDVKTSPLKGLKPGAYIFRWSLKGEGFYSEDEKTKSITDDKNQKIEIQIEQGTKIYFPLNPKIQITPPTTIASNDASVVFVISEKEKSFKLEYYDSQKNEWKKIHGRDLENLELKYGLNYIIRRSNKDSQLQYQDSKNKVEKWVNVTSNKIEKKLAPGKYNLRWKLLNDKHTYEQTDRTTHDVGYFIVGESSFIPIPKAKDLTFNTQSPLKQGQKGKIIFSKDPTKDPYSLLQYKSSKTDWTNAPTTAIESDPGIYSFKWIPKSKYQKYSYPSGEKELVLANQEIAKSNFIENPPLDFEIETTPTSYIGADDGTITIKNLELSNAYSKLQFQKLGSSGWNDIQNTKIQNLKEGQYKFRWEPINRDVTSYAQNKKEWLLVGKDVLVTSTNKIPLVPLDNWKVVSHSPSLRKKADGLLKLELIKKYPYSQLLYLKDKDFNIWAEATSAISNFEIPTNKSYIFKYIDKYSKLQYKKDGDEDWQDFVDSQALNLLSGIYSLRWVGKNYEMYQNNEHSVKWLNKVTIGDSSFIKTPLDPIFNVTPPTAKNSADALVKITHHSDIPYNYQEFSTDGVKWEKNKGKEEAWDKNKYYQVRWVNQDVKLQYSYNNANEWKDVENNEIKKLNAGTLKFRWKTKEDLTKFVGGKNIYQVKGQITILQSKKLLVPKLNVPKGLSFKVIPALTNWRDGQIIITNGDNPHLKMQFSRDEKKWTNVVGNKITGLYEGFYFFRWVPKNKDDVFLKTGTKSSFITKIYVKESDFLKKEPRNKIQKLLIIILPSVTFAIIGITTLVAYYSKVKKRKNKV